MSTAQRVYVPMYAQMSNVYISTLPEA